MFKVSLDSVSIVLYPQHLSHSNVVVADANFLVAG